MKQATRLNIWRRIMAGVCYLLAVVLLVGCGTPQTVAPGPAKATTPTVSPVVPPGRRFPQIAYDGKTSTLLLFGGRGLDGFLKDTWTWDGTSWTQQHPATSPPPRESASMAYDAATGQVVLFGGCPEGCLRLLGDTWTWDGRNWTQQHPLTSPPVRIGASMAYDTATQRLVLFGGVANGTGSGENTPPLLQDTWTWDGTNWTQQHPAISPTPRTDASMAYAAATHQMVLFGGTHGYMLTSTLQDTWIWDGTSWTQQHPATSPVNKLQFSNSMTYDEATQEIVLMLIDSESDTSPFVQRSWTWNGSTWAQQATQTPAQDEGSLVYGTSQQTLFEFSSFLPHQSDSGIPVDKLWKLTGHQWQQLAVWGG